MIELNEKTQQDFLNREWVQKLLNAGVDMSDAKYSIGRMPVMEIYDYIYLGKPEYNVSQAGFTLIDKIPTYTVSELLYKLHEWIYPTIDGVKYSGGLCLWKDAPFYPAQYRLEDKNGEVNEDIFFCSNEYPIESLASLLIQCHTHDIGISAKDTGNISDK
jgi:hypothetical protein